MTSLSSSNSRVHSVSQSDLVGLLSHYDLKPGLHEERSLLQYLHNERTRLLRELHDSRQDNLQLRAKCDTSSTEQMYIEHKLCKTEENWNSIVQKTSEVRSMVKDRLATYENLAAVQSNSETSGIGDCEYSAEQIAQVLTQRDEARKKVVCLREELFRLRRGFESQEKEYIGMIHEKRERVELLQRTLEGKNEELGEIRRQARAFYDTTQRQKSSIAELVRNVNEANRMAEIEKRKAMKEQIRKRKLKESLRYMQEEMEELRNENRLLRFQVKKLNDQLARSKSQRPVRSFGRVFQGVRARSNAQSPEEEPPEPVKTKRPAPKRNKRKPPLRRKMPVKRKRKVSRKKKRKRPRKKAAVVEEEKSEEDCPTTDIPEPDSTPPDEPEPVDPETVEEGDIEPARKLVVLSAKELQSTPSFEEEIREVPDQPPDSPSPRNVVNININFSPSSSHQSSTYSLPLVEEPKPTELEDPKMEPEGDVMHSTLPQESILPPFPVNPRLRRRRDESVPRRIDTSNPFFSWFPCSLPVSTKQPYKQHSNPSRSRVRLMPTNQSLRVQSSKTPMMHSPTPASSRSVTRLQNGDEVVEVTPKTHKSGSLASRIELRQRIHARRVRANRNRHHVESRKRAVRRLEAEDTDHRVKLIVKLNESFPSPRQMRRSGFAPSPLTSGRKMSGRT